MKNPKDNFIKGRVRSFKYAFRGLWLLIKTEASIKSQLVLGTLISILGLVMDLSVTEWLFQTLSIGLVLTAESLNTGIEKLCDFVNPDYDKRIGFIKDISAGAVAFAALFALIIGLIIYLPKFINI
jgi:diacylglycerol kinase (ATP)